MDKEFFTTFEIGQLCKVYHTTVINWINKGQLRAHVTPGGHRRVQKKDLLQFMRTFQIPIPKELDSSKRKVLVVDDDPNIVRMLGKAFFGMQSEVELEITNNGVDALVRIGKNMPDLLILDIVMPEMDGLEVCKRLKADSTTKKIGIISISGETLSTEQHQFLKANVDAFFQKPFSVREVIHKSRAILGLEEEVYEAQNQQKWKWSPPQKQ